MDTLWSEALKTGHLSLLLSQALQDILQDAEGSTQRLKRPTRSSSMNSRLGGRLEAVERAMGLMAGYGLQQVFGVNDFETAKWLSQMMGQETTGYQTDSYKPGDAPSFCNNLVGRDLLTPDKIMQLRPENQLLRVQGQATAVAQKLRYYADPEFKGLFVPQDQ